MSQVRTRGLYASSTENMSSTSASLPNSSGYDAGRSSNSSVETQNSRKRPKRDKKLPTITMTIHNVLGVVRKSVELDLEGGNLERAVEKCKQYVEELVQGCWQDIHPGPSQQDSHSSIGDSFRFNRTMPSSTPLHPPNPIQTSSSASDLFDRAPEGDDAETQNPYLSVPYFDPAILRKTEELIQVSEESDSDDMPQHSTSFVDAQKNSLEIEYGNAKGINSVYGCTPQDHLDPRPDAFEGIKVVFSSLVDETFDNVEGINKQYYSETICKGGGEVLDDIPTKDRTNTILVSDKHSRSYKYLHALLLGIPCISKDWIDDCTDKNYTREQCRIENINPALYLNRGINFLTNKPVIQQYLPNTKPIPAPFTGQTVYLQGTNLFKDTWQDIVKSGGGTGLKRWFKTTSVISYPTVVASDGTKKPSTTTLNFGKPRVSTEWLIQCIVTGELAEFKPFLF